MNSQINDIENRLNEITKSLDFHKKNNEMQLEGFKDIGFSLNSSKKLGEKFIEKFELIDLKLKNVESEFELLHTEIRTLKILIETINIKLKMLE